MPEIENPPKSSASDSKLAVDYFNIKETEILQRNTSPLVSFENLLESNIINQTLDKENDTVNISDSQHSLYVQSDPEAKLIQEVKLKRPL